LASSSPENNRTTRQRDDWASTNCFNVMKEKDIQRQITDYLILQKIFFYRNNTGGFSREDGHFYRFGVVGSPDLVLVIKGKYIGVEVKTKIGRQSPAQLVFQKALEASGGIYLLVRSLDELIEKLKLQAFNLRWKH